MARKPRIHFAGALYHVILRGKDNWTATFYVKNVTDERAEIDVSDPGYETGVPGYAPPGTAWTTMTNRPRSYGIRFSQRFCLTGEIWKRAGAIRPFFMGSESLLSDELVTSFENVPFQKVAAGRPSHGTVLLRRIAAKVMKTKAKNPALGRVFSFLAAEG